VGHNRDEPFDFGILDSSIDDDALDAELPEATHQFAHRLGSAGDGNIADDEFLTHDTDCNRCSRLMDE
jgi:hypothetical protein